MKTKLFTLLGVFVWLAGRISGAELSDNMYNQLQLLCTDLNSAKVDLVNRVMKLSADDAKKFWPIYRDYQTDLNKLATKRAEFIAEFVKSHGDGSFDNDKAKSMAKRWFDGENERLDLLQKYHKKVGENLSAIQAAQFLQIEHQIGILIDLTIASEMPKVGEKLK